MDISSNLAFAIMTDQHRATPEQWAQIERSAEEVHGDGCSAILELRDRIAALEAAQLEQAESNRFCTDAIVRRVEALEDPMTELRAASADLNSSAGLTSSPGGLVERIEAVAGGDGRTAIREAAKWLRSVGNNRSADDLEQEADRG